jgi:hypothetical protein
MFGPKDFGGGHPLDERKRDSIVAYLRRRMDEFGITVDDLAAAMAAQTPPGTATVTCLNGLSERSERDNR